MNETTLKKIECTMKAKQSRLGMARYEETIGHQKKIKAGFEGNIFVMIWFEERSK